MKDPGQRITMPGIMAHPWFQKVSTGYTRQQLCPQRTAWLPVGASVAALLAAWWAWSPDALQLLAHLNYRRTCLPACWSSTREWTPSPLRGRCALPEFASNSLPRLAVCATSSNSLVFTPTRCPPPHCAPPASFCACIKPHVPTQYSLFFLSQSEDEVRSVVREAQGSMRVIDADNIDEMADDILAEEEADDLLEGARRLF